MMTLVAEILRGLLALKMVFSPPWEDFCPGKQHQKCKCSSKWPKYYVYEAKWAVYRGHYTQWTDGSLWSTDLALKVLRTIEVLSSPHTAQQLLWRQPFWRKNGKDSMTIYNGLPLTLACKVTNNVCCTANLGPNDSKYDAIQWIDKGPWPLKAWL